MDGKLKTRILTAVTLALVVGAVEVLNRLTAESQLAAETRLYHQARSAFGLGVTLAPQLKVLALDDRTVGAIKGNQLDILTFVKTARMLERAGAKAVIVNAMFSQAFETPDRLAEALKISDGISKLTLVSGLMVTRNRIDGWKSLPMNEPAISLERLLPADGDRTASVPADDSLFGGFVYGPSPHFRRITNRFGHFMASRHPATATLFYRLSPAHLVPSFTMQFTDDQGIKNGRYVFEGKAVPMNDRSEVMPLWVEPDKIRLATKSLKHYVNLVQTGHDETATLSPSIVPGDIVFLDFGGYTGGGGFIESPFGRVKGSNFSVTLLNSLLEGRWIWYGEWPLAYSVSATLLAFLFFVRFKSTSGVATTLVLAPTVLLTIALALFAFADAFVPCIGPSFAFASTLAVLHSVRRTREVRRERAEKLYLEKDLDLANRIQDSLSPPQRGTTFGPFAISCFQAKHEALGGDWMAVREGAEGEVFLAVADATGKGVQAALIVHAVQSLWADALAAPAFDPEAFLRRVNQTLFTMSKNHPHTLTMGILKLTATELMYWSAGHLPALVHDDSGVKRLSAFGDILGLERAIQLVPKGMVPDLASPGFCVLLASDGVLNGTRAMGRRQIKALIEGISDSGVGHLEAIPEVDDKTLIFVTLRPSETYSEVPRAA